MKTARFLIFSLAFLMLSADGLGQTASTAGIAGVVTDANGAVVAGAAVKLVDKATGAEKTAATDNGGRYVFAVVEPGNYDLTVTAQGFRTSVTTGIKAEVTRVATIDVLLQVGGAAEQVTVTASSEAQLQTTDAALGNVIDADRIKRLPTANRQATDLLRLQPLVTPTGEVSGSRADQNTYTLDGIDVTDQVGFRGAFFTVVPTPTESIEEFRSTTRAMSSRSTREPSIRAVWAPARRSSLISKSCRCRTPRASATD